MNEDEKIKLIADLRIREYFEHFKATLPAILDNHIKVCPHGRQISRVKWALVGAVIVIATTTPFFGRVILATLFKI